MLLSIFSYFLIMDIIRIPSTVILNSNSVDSIKSNSFFSNLYTFKKIVESTPCSSYCNNLKTTYTSVELFGFLPVKKIQLNEVIEDKIWASGKTVGIALQSKGVVVVGKSPLIADSQDNYCDNFEIGDVIMQIEGEEINSAENVEEVINITFGYKGEN